MYNLITMIINRLTLFIQYIAISIIAGIMLFIPIAILSKEIYRPIIGEVELIQLGMVVIIMFGLAYTQKVDGHISIGLIVDRFPQKVQKVLDIFSCALVLIATVSVGIIFWKVGIKHKVDMQISTDLLSIPFYPFDFIISIGFIMWGLVTFLHLTKSIVSIFSDNEYELEGK